MKILSCLILMTLLLLSSVAAGQTHSKEEIQVIGRLQTSGGKIQLIRSQEGDAIPSLLKNKELEETLKSMAPGDEAVVRGYISYQGITQIEGPVTHQPVFVIESIKPISLKILGKVELPREFDNPSFSLTSRQPYSPLTIPVSTEVASAMTIATSMILLQSLSSPPHRSGGQESLNSGVLLYAGLFATGVFIFQQVMSSAKDKP